MSKTTSLELNCLDQNDQSVKKSISCVNPNASDSVLKTFSQKYNALTNNTLVTVTRVDKSDITDAE